MAYATYPKGAEFIWNNGLQGLNAQNFKTVLLKSGAQFNSAHTTVHQVTGNGIYEATAVGSPAGDKVIPGATVGIVGDFLSIAGSSQYWYGLDAGQLIVGLVMFIELGNGRNTPPLAIFLPDTQVVTNGETLETHWLAGTEILRIRSLVR